MLKTYQATSMAQALAEVKRDLGRDAVILHTRSFRKGGLMGLGGRPMWEVTASQNINVPQRVTRGQYLAAADGQAAPEYAAQAAQALLDLGEARSVKQPIAVNLDWPTPEAREETWRRQVGLQRPSSKPAAAPVVAPSIDPELSREVTEIKQLVKSIIQTAPAAVAAPVTSQAAATATLDAPVPVAPARRSMPSELGEFHAQLLRQDVEEKLADGLMDQLRLSLAGTKHYDSKLIADRLCDLIASRIQTTSHEAPRPTHFHKPRVIALIGPTGVGKTTTIAKLAAEFKLRRNQRVGLVTIDTYRIAAVDQLRTYAEIIEVPLRTVLSAGELHQAIYGMPDVDVILIDTAGRSQNDSPRLNELRSFLAAAGADEVHLVISATANRRVAMNTMHRFGPLGANRIILTKLDEAESYGTILSLSAGGASALSFVTTGQDVPDDIETADPWRLAQRVLKGNEYVC